MSTGELWWTWKDNWDWSKVHDGVSSFSEPMDIIEFEDYALKNLSAFITVGYKF